MQTQAHSQGHEADSHSAFERALGLLTRMRPGEGRTAALFFLLGFLVLFAYYIVKALRAALILTEFGAEGKAYATGVMAALLMLLLPLYSALRRRVDGVPLTKAVTWVFIVSTLVFAALTRTSLHIGYAFFVWAGLFGVALVGHFWAFAADTFNLKSGQRLFPLIMMGGSLGAIAGAQAAKWAAASLSPTGLLILAAAVLAATLGLPGAAHRSVPEGSRSTPIEPHEKPVPRILGGFATVFHDRYLLLIAVLVVVLTWINSTGEFVLDSIVVEHVNARIAADPALQANVLFTEFYADFIFYYTILGLLIQAFVVSHVYRWIGVRGALLISPIIAAVSYGLVVFLPVFGLIRVVKILDNGLDYSLTNTTRQALFLPVSRAAKYDGKMTIDTFFFRFGDLLQAVVVFFGLNYWNLQTADFAMFNFVIALLWLAIAWAIGREYVRRAHINPTNVAPELRRPIPDCHWMPGKPIAHAFDHDTFVDSDPGDVLHYRARVYGGSDLPQWLRFDPRLRHFTGQPPHTFKELHIEVVASDVDGFEVSCSFRVLRVS
jgi:AAA family ATP:ADP antiporter